MGRGGAGVGAGGREGTLSLAEATCAPWVAVERVAVDLTHALRVRDTKKNRYLPL